MVRKRGRLRVEHNSNPRDVWRDFLEQPQPFPTYRGFKICKPSNIGARTRQVRDKPAADWVRDGGEYDGNGTRLGLKRRSCRSGTSKDDVGLHCHEFFCKCTDATGISSRPAIVKPDVAFSRPSQLLKAVSGLPWRGIVLPDRFQRPPSVPRCGAAGWACCACVVSGHATVDPAITLMNSRRLMCHPQAQETASYRFKRVL